MHIHDLGSVMELHSPYQPYTPMETTQLSPDRELLERAADRGTSYAAVARHTGISLRRLHKIKAGSPLHADERRVLTLFTTGKLP